LRKTVFEWVCALCVGLVSQKFVSTLYDISSN
jgi:hypothetical protein